MAYYNNQSQDQTIMWDLRVFRVAMIARYWEKISMCQEVKNYSEWFRTLHLLETCCNHAINKEFVDKDYLSLRQTALKVMNKYPLVFKSKSSDSEGETEIEESLLMIEKYLYKKIDKGGLFGKNRELRGL